MAHRTGDDMPTDDTPDIPPMRYPPWMDPRYIVSTCDWRTFEVTCNLAGEAPLVPANPLRWAIGFVRGVTSISDAAVAPFREAFDAGERLPTTQAWKWFTLFEFGPLVCAEWYVQGANPATVRVIEVLLH